MGMHEGHAIEGLIFGLCSSICAEKEGYTVVHSHLGLPLTMKTDVLILKDSALHANIMVCHSDNRDYSHRKIKRTRQEFVEALQLAKSKLVTPDYRVINLVFGMPNGWMESQIPYMKNELYPTLYLPDFLNKVLYDKFISWAINQYKKSKTSKSNWRASITAHILKNSNIVPGQKIIQDVLRNLIFSDDCKNHSSKGDVRHSAQKADQMDRKRPISPFFSRYRQGLSMLNMFAENEVAAIYRVIKNGSTQPENLDSLERSSLIRALWMGVVNIEEDITGELFVSTRKRGDNPTVFDFDEPFKSMSLEQIIVALDKLNLHAKASQTTFIGGLQCLSMANFSSVSKALLLLVKELKRYLKNPTEKSLHTVLKIFLSDSPLLPDTGSIQSGHKPFLIYRSFASALITVLYNNPKLGGKHGYGFNGTECFSKGTACQFLAQLNNKANEAINELGLVEKMMEAFSTCQLSSVKDWSLNALRPKTFSIEVPGSWMQRFYFVAVSHAAYNPLMSVLYSQLVCMRHQASEVCGFPSKLAQSIADLTGKNDAPGKFRIVVPEGSRKYHIYEVISITENNLGNKSKELFDRIGSVKSWGVLNGVQFIVHGVFDGDFAETTIEEFSGPARYDEFISTSLLMETLAAITIDKNIEPLVKSQKSSKVDILSALGSAQMPIAAETSKTPKLKRKGGHA